MMTQREYNAWIARMRLLGELERQRKEEERSNPEGLKQFLIFLDELHRTQLKKDSRVLEDLSKTNLRIARQQLLARFPKR